MRRATAPRSNGQASPTGRRSSGNSCTSTGQNIGEARNGLAVGALHLACRTEGLDDQVDRPVLQVQPAVGEAGAATALIGLLSPRRTRVRASTSSSVTAREA